MNRLRRWVAASAGCALAAGMIAVPVPAQAAGSDPCTADFRLNQPVPALGMLQSDLAWSVTRGAGVTVAVVDSGVSANNPHLTAAVSGGVNLVPDGTDAAGTTDQYGHGTAIAGQIAARKIDGSSVEGLAPEARIMPVRVFAGADDRQVQAGFGPSAARMADGIRYAASHGAQIINVSMSMTAPDPAVSAAVAEATARGSLVIASAGNRDSNMSLGKSDQDGTRYPAGDPSAVGVAATDLNGVVTETSIHGPHVSVAALGQSILTTSAAGGDCSYADTDPATSYAAAYVSAAAALVAAAHPRETPAQWAYRLEATAVRPDPGSRDDSAGWGIVQPYEAMMLVPGPGIPGPPSPFDVGDEPVATPTPAAAVVVHDDPPADAAAIALGLVTAIGGLVVLGAAGAGGVLVARRRAAGRATVTRVGRGLYGEPPA
ncbi:S8 family serine peptidase [Microbacterium sp. SORGH_AS_0888]|uniref:S8 family serine peptidase n=1 Tax=Microbacterium sp. SORGH_AS_0888 TaxID=3041791 RepID=UPI002786B203|nr:S8 family serine peptidase [Microbacterium sp. SORGH_AS_0888]MDQ1129576.1 membrane-anchored mycosin MYCP [Microbacterium sp. SORGH_AS_0888]